MSRHDLPRSVDAQALGSMDDELETLPVFVSPIPIHPTSITRVSTVGAQLAFPDPETLLPAWKEQLRRSKSNEGRKRIPYQLFPGLGAPMRDAAGQYDDIGGHWMPQQIRKAGRSTRTEEAAAAVIAAAAAATASPRMSDAAHAFLHTVAGAAGAVVALAVVYPLDSLRTIQSVQGGTAWEVAKLHLRHGGWRRLYRGMRAAFAGVIFSWGTYFFVYTLAKQKEKNRRGSKAKTGTNLPMAIGAGICSTVISNPFWVANTRLKVDFSSKAEERGIFRMLVEILRKEGFRGWLAGIVPALVLVLNPAIQFALYDHLRQKVVDLKQKWRTASPSSSSNSLSSQHSSSGSLTSERRLLARVTPLESFLMASVRSLIMILETEGLQGLFAGLPSKLAATLLSSAIMFTVYEQLLPFVLLAFKPMVLPSSHKKDVQAPKRTR